MNQRIPIDRIVDFAAGRLSPEESLALLDRIEHDEMASKDLDMVAATMDLLEEEGDALSLERAETGPSLLACAFARLRSSAGGLLPRLRAHPVLSGVAAFACVLALLMVMVPRSSPYGMLASLQDFDFGATVRGVELEEFGAAFDLYRESKYDQAIKTFERYIRAFPRNGLLDYAHYSAGAAYLRWSEWRLFSLFIGFDRARVQKGMDHLHEVVRISNNVRLLEDSRWLLAKGSLMLSEVDEAKEELGLIVQMGGNRREEARVLLQALQTTEQQR